MLNILDQSNLATGGLEDNDMAIVIRRSLSFDLMSRHEADAPGSPIAMVQHVLNEAEKHGGRIDVGDAGVVLKWTGGFQVFMINEGAPSRMADDVRLYQSLALMNAALALRNRAIMTTLLQAADAMGMPRDDEAVGLSPRQREQRRHLRGLQAMLISDDLFEVLCEITTNEANVATPFSNMLRH